MKHRNGKIANLRAFKGRSWRQARKEANPNTSATSSTGAGLAWINRDRASQPCSIPSSIHLVIL